MTESVPQPTGTTTHSCESCGMPIETGRWCTYCTTDSGELQPFDERFARMVAWQERRHPEQSRADAEAATLAYLATMPAWRGRAPGRGPPVRRPGSCGRETSSGRTVGTNGRGRGRMACSRTCVRS